MIQFIGVGILTASVIAFVRRMRKDFKASASPDAAKTLEPPVPREIVNYKMDNSVEELRR